MKAIRRVFGAVFLVVPLVLTSPVWCAIPATFLSDLGQPESVETMLPLGADLWLATLSENSVIWFSDGTRGGTVPVKEVPPLRESPVQLPLYYRLSNKVFFVTGKAGTTQVPELWVSNATAAGTFKLANFSQFWFLGDMGDILFFVGPDNCVWRTNGTVGGTYALTSSAGTDYGHEGVVLNGVLYWSMVEQNLGVALWRTDGTAAGTWRVKTVDPDRESCILNHPLVTNGRLCIIGSDTEHGRELWGSDGTPDGTHMLKDIAAGPDDATVTIKGAMDTWLLFWADDLVHGWEPWRSDGTAEGTCLLKDIIPGADYSGLGGCFARLGDTAYFAAGAHTLETFSAWKSDGTEGGTVPIFTPSGVDFTEDIPYVHDVRDGYVYFTTPYPAGGGHEHRLYRVNNSTEPSLVATWPYEIVTHYQFRVWTFGGEVYFGEDDQFYHVNGTTPELVVLEDSALGRTGSGYCFVEPVLVNDYLFIHGEGLWVIDTLPFRFSEVPRAQWREVGDPLLLRVACASTSGEITYQWIKDSLDIPDQNGQTYEVGSLTENDEGWYSCRVTDETKAVRETEPVFVEVFEEGALPAAGPLALLALAAACTMGAARAIRRKKR